MMRRLAVVFVILLLAVPVVVVAAPQIGDTLQAWMDQTDDRLDALEAAVGATTTTTTEPPTTTTTAPTTTTTTLPPGAAYVDHCDRDTRLSECFTIILTNAETGEKWWDAPYARDLTYTAGAGWVDGDKSGYRCAYMFLENGGEIVGRVWFVRGALYGKVNDSGMAEGVRAYDGGPYLSQSECPNPDQEYAPNDTPDQRPTVRYMAGGDTLEVRSYPHTTILAAAGKFVQLDVITEPFTDQGDDPNSQPHTVYSRVLVGFYTLQNGEWLPGMLVYYDSLSPDVEVTTDLGS